MTSAHPIPNMCLNGIRGIVVCTALVLQWTIVERLLSDPEGLAAYSVLLLGYLVFEIWQQHVRAPGTLLLTPPVLASVATFIIPFSVSNLLFVLSEETLATVGFPTTVGPWMNRLMVLVVLGACCMWAGYSSRIGLLASRVLHGSHVLRRLLSHSTHVNRSALYVCIGVSCAARVLQLEWGVLGYGEYDRLIALAQYREYLALLGLLGTWALICVAMERFASSRPTLGDRQLLWLLFGYELTWGFLTGFKFMVVLPVVLVALAHHVQRGRLPRWFVPALGTAVLTGYLVIEPYRALWNAGAVGSGSGGVVIAMLGGTTDSVATDTRSSMALRLATRTNLTYTASLGIEYAESGPLPPGSPDFLGNILRAPVHAIVPRLLWDTKPLQDIGIWYTRQVMGRDLVSSTAMSAITYLNFAGGAVAIACGFLFVGFAQRVLFEGLRVFGAGGWLVLLGLLPTLTNIEHAFDTFIASIIRLLPLLTLVQYFLFQGNTRDERLSSWRRGQRHVHAAGPVPLPRQAAWPTAALRARPTLRPR